MKFYFVLVNYNNAEVTIKCIESIFNQKYFTSSGIIIVDNNSKQEDREKLKAYSEYCKILFLDENVGYFKAINQGLLTIYDKANTDVRITVGNNDLIFDENFLSNLYYVKYPDDIFVISPDIYKLNGIHQNPMHINRISATRRMIYRINFIHYNISVLLNYMARLLKLKDQEKSRVGFDSRMNIHMGFGACYILTPSFFREFDLLDAPVFLNGEEAILSNQIHSRKGKILYDPSLKVIHNDHSTFKMLPSRFGYECGRKSYKIYRKYL